MDLASHAAGVRTNAMYDRSSTSYTLYAKPGMSIDKGEEITITYGDEKGACEMIFSYGFIDAAMSSAGTLFLSLTIPEQVTSRRAKLEVAQCAPGFKIIETQPSSSVDRSDVDSDVRTIDWEGDFIWFLCLSEEDGFAAQVAVDVDGQEHFELTFGTQVISDGAAGLRRMLASSELWDVYLLRATVLLQQRVFDQLQVLYSSQDEAEATEHGEGTSVRDGPFATAMRLRALEFDLLNRAYESFEEKVCCCPSTRFLYDCRSMLTSARNLHLPIRTW